MPLREIIVRLAKRNIVNAYETENIVTAPNTPTETYDQLNKPAKSGKLEVSDLITIGVFAALYFVMVCIATLVSTLFTSGFGSIFLPAITAFISGCVYMLLAARLGKFGGITVMGVIIGLFLFISGHFVLSFIASIVFPVAADLIARAGKYEQGATARQLRGVLLRPDRADPAPCGS